MAPAARHLGLLLAAVLIVLNASGGADARPCRTIFISYSSDDPVVRITHIRGAYPSGEGSVSSSAAFFTVHRVFRARYRDGDVLPAIPLPAEIQRTGASEADPRLAFDLGKEGLRSSLQQRARDILVVVAGLLFGVGCGALTAAIMFFAWSIVTSRRQICGGADDSEEEVESPKRMGYVTIPTLPEPAPPTKGYEGN